jgi:hypothetical protein
MKSGKGILLILSHSGMEIFWRYAWVCLLMLAFMQRSFPLTEALAAFAAAALITRISRQKKWRRIQAAICHFAGFILIAGLITFRVCFADASFFSTAWLADLLRRLHELNQWFITLLLFFCQLLFWLGGHRLMKNRIHYTSVCIQFDKGLGAFFLLFLIILVVQGKGGVVIAYPTAAWMVFAFFIFSMLSIGLARVPGDGRKSFRAGYGGIGVILIFTSIVALSCAVLVLFFLPQLTSMAEATRIVLKETTEPMGPVVVQIIRFIFQSRKFDDGSGNSVGGTPDAPGIHSSPGGGFEGTFEMVIGWGLIAMLGLGAAIILWGLGKYLMAWLLKRNTTDVKQYHLLERFFRFISAILAIPVMAWSAMLSFFKRFDSAVPVYRGMLGWGRRSGLPALQSETPMEYGQRLSQHFPQLSEDIKIIIETFNIEVYGSIAIDQLLLARILSARRTMQSPRHWPARIKIWFAQQPQQRHQENA